MNFSFATQKLKAADVGRIRGHNERHHPTASQLPPPAWFDPRSAINGVPWQQAKVDRARSLSKRKDAVVAISVVIQVGDQHAWRGPPSPEFPYGRPKNPPPADVLKLAQAATTALARTFGKDNLVSVSLHLDESSPHVHAVVTPVKDGKLQAKAWLDGRKRLSELRRQIYEVVNAAIPCTYSPGNGLGGQPHNRHKAAGAEIQTVASELLALKERDQVQFENLMEQANLINRRP